MKPLKAFPFPLNVGTDICQISRIFHILRGPHGARFVRRVLTTGEQGRVNFSLLESAEAKTSGTGTGIGTDDVLSLKRQTGWEDGAHGQLARLYPGMWDTASFMAGRFAAKEAAMKAHWHRRLTFHDIIIEKRAIQGETLGSGPPIARILGEKETEEDQEAMVSISHDGDYATAVCMGHVPPSGKTGGS